MYPSRVDSRKFIESLYEEFGNSSPLKLTNKIGKKSRIRSKKKKVKKKSVFKDTKKQRKVKRK